jgi:hypothetical protein
MLVLVATNEQQGEMPDDYTWTVEGELVTPVVAECCAPDTCGCATGFPGLASSRATTTAMIADLPHISEADLRDVIEGALERDGWFDLLDDDHASVDASATLAAELVDEHLVCISAVCARFPVGTVLGRTGDVVFSRSIDQAA